MKILLVALLVAAVAGTVLIPLISEQFVTAKTIKKVHFTQTLISSQDPGEGYGEHQFVLVLSPNAGTIYDGSMTFSSSEPVTAVVLHEIASGKALGQPVWTVDGTKQYAISVIGAGARSDSVEFTGAALALRSINGTEFTVTVSVDGWVRGQPIEVIEQTIKQEEKASLKLSRANVPATMPMHAGLYEGGEILYVITDSNDEEEAERITTQQKWRVEAAPVLSEAPQDALGDVYIFTNGIAGNGMRGYQPEVFSSTPAQADEYGALRSVMHVKWKSSLSTEVLDSVEAILEVAEKKRIEIEETTVILNMPQVKWPGGQMPISDSEIADGMIHGKAQISEINAESMTVTFIAHRGWGPDGRTIYRIVTDATPEETAYMMGAASSPASAGLIANAAAADLFEFKNGIAGSGPLGFQPGIASAAPGDEGYSPISRILLVEWNDPSEASVLETRSDIDALSEEEAIITYLARPLNSDHIINSPIVDPFQNPDEE